MHPISSPIPDHIRPISSCLACRNYGACAVVGCPRKLSKLPLCADVPGHAKSCGSACVDRWRSIICRAMDKMDVRQRFVTRHSVRDPVNVRIVQNCYLFDGTYLWNALSMPVLICWCCTYFCLSCIQHGHTCKCPPNNEWENLINVRCCHVFLDDDLHIIAACQAVRQMYGFGILEMKSVVVSWETCTSHLRRSLHRGLQVACARQSIKFNLNGKMTNAWFDMSWHINRVLLGVHVVVDWRTRMARIGSTKSTRSISSGISSWLCWHVAEEEWRDEYDKSWTGCYSAAGLYDVVFSIGHPKSSPKNNQCQRWRMDSIDRPLKMDTIYLVILMSIHFHFRSGSMQSMPSISPILTTEILVQNRMSWGGQ